MLTPLEEEVTAKVASAHRVNPAELHVEATQVSSLVFGTDDVTGVEASSADEAKSTDHPRIPQQAVSPRGSTTRSSLEPRPSVTATVIAEVASFHDVFGALGVPMIIVFALSACWTFTLAVIQVYATEMANAVMDTAQFDNGEFWLLPQPDLAIIASSVVMLALFGVGYTGLVIMMLFFSRIGHQGEPVTSSTKDKANPGNSSDVVTPLPTAGDTTHSEIEQTPHDERKFRCFIEWVHHKCYLPSEIRHNYYSASLDIPKLVFQTVTLITYLRSGFPTAIIYCYSVLQLCNWLVTCYRYQRYVADPNLFIARLYYTFDLFFAVFAPLVVLIYFIYTFQFDREAFLTKTETIGGGSYDTIARLFGDPTEISSFCSAFHYLQFSSGESLFYKSALNLLSLYKWRKIIVTLIRNHHERRLAREHKALVRPITGNVTPTATRKNSLSAALVKKIQASARKPKFGKYFVPKFLLPLIFLVAGITIFTYSIGAVSSSTALCRKYDKCVVTSYQWNFGYDHCTCLVFADRQLAPRTYAEWTDPVDAAAMLGELAVAGELRIVQIINRAVSELPEQLRHCHKLQQLILIYTKTLRLPEWISEFSHLEYFHVEGDFTSKRLQTVPAGIFDNMPHLTFLHLAGIPDVEELPSLSSLHNLKYLALVILNSLREVPSFEGLSKVNSLQILEAARAETLPSLAPLTSLTSLGLRYRSASCCNGFISGTCDFTEFQCLPKEGEKFPMTCTDQRVSAEDKARLDSYGDAICLNSFAYDLEASAPSKHTTDELCGGIMFKECDLGGVQGICFNTRMMAIGCVTQSSYITMRKLQIQRGVGDTCDPATEAWLGCTV